MSDDDDFEIQEVPVSTPNFRTQLAAQLADLVPEAVADGKIDVIKLKELLDDDATDESERFGLFWPGKRRAMRAAQEPTTATLRPDFENSTDWDTTQNVFIEGDNLEVLKILQRHYHGKVKMIYIDPPYNTGKDFVYPDNYKEGLESYLEWTKQVNEDGKKVATNAETEGRYHSNWLNMMYPRLKLARNLLTDDGVLFMSIDDHEVAHLRKVADEVFGEANFVCQFIWHSSTGGGIRAKYVNVSHQYVLCYVKDDQRADMFWAPLSPEAVSQYKQADENGPYRDKDFAWRNSSTNPNQVYPITAPDGQCLLPKKGYIYRFVEERFRRELATGSISFKRTDSGPFVDENGQQARWNIYVKKYLNSGKGAPTSVIPRALVGINNEGTTEVHGLLGGRYFDNPKNVRLIDYLLEIGAPQDSIVLDFFAGSGSTAHAVLSKNALDGGRRTFILVQLPEPTPDGSDARLAGFKSIAEVSRCRIRRAGDALMQASDVLSAATPPTVDIGFRAFRLVDTSFSAWRVSSDVGLEAIQQVFRGARDGSSADDALADDLLTELLLKQGYSLTEKIESLDVAGLQLRSVGGGVLLAYLDEHIKPTLDQLRAIVDLNPASLIILEDAFDGDDELKANLVQMCRSKARGSDEDGIKLWTA